MKTVSTKSQALISFVVSGLCIGLAIYLNERRIQGVNYQKTAIIPDALQWIVNSYRYETNGTSCALDYTRFNLDPWECFYSSSASEKSNFPNSNANTKLDYDAADYFAPITSAMTLIVYVMLMVQYKKRQGLEEVQLPLRFFIASLFGLMSLLTGLFEVLITSRLECNTVYKAATFATQLLTENNTYSAVFFPNCHKSIPFPGKFAISHFTPADLNGFNVTTTAAPVEASTAIGFFSGMMMSLATLSSAFFLKALAEILLECIKSCKATREARNPSVVVGDHDVERQAADERTSLLATGQRSYH